MGTKLLMKMDYFDINKVPYISTYYIKPVVATNEEVLIDYYITDWYFKEYNEKYNLYKDNWGDDNWTESVWNEETFTVIVNVEGNEQTYTDLPAGDHQVSLGSFANEGEVNFSIKCIDRFGRCSHELHNYFLVQNTVAVNEYVMTEADLTTYNIKNEDTYEVKQFVDLTGLETKDAETVTAELQNIASTTVPSSNTYVLLIPCTEVGFGERWWKYVQTVYASDYDKEAVLAEATATKEGLQNLIDDKKNEGYNRIKLLPGVYRIDNTLPIYLPTQFTLDMNGATIKMNPFTGDSCYMVEINNCTDTHCINGTVEGDFYGHDYTNSPNNSEWACGIMIGGEAKYCSYEDMTIKDITGYGVANGIQNSRDGSKGYTYLPPKGVGTFVEGDIDRDSGLEIKRKERTRSGFIDISNYEGVCDYISVSVYLGYQGNPCGAWNLITFFYDGNKNYIKSIDAYQYRRIKIPNGARYMRVVILNRSFPTNLSVQYFRVPTHCAFKNLTIDNCRCVGVAQAAMNNFLVENCEFTRSGRSSANCAYDAEDGWDMMQDVTFKRLNFHDNPANEFLTCAGHNFIIDGQVNGKVHTYDRTRNLVIKNSNIKTANIYGGGRPNIVRHGVARIFNNTLVDGNFDNNLAKNNISETSLSGKILNSTMTRLTYNNDNYNCTINIPTEFTNYNTTARCIKCNFVPDSSLTDRYKISLNQGHKNAYQFIDCNFYGKCVLADHGAFFSGYFKNCEFEDVYLEPNVMSDVAEDKIVFENCKMNYSGKFIYYRPFAYSIGVDSKIIFKNCEITNIKADNAEPFFYAYAKPNGYCRFEDCTISGLVANQVMFNGYPSNYQNITNYRLEFINTPLPNDVVMLYSDFATLSNITVIQE